MQIVQYVSNIRQMTNKPRPWQFTFEWPSTNNPGLHSRHQQPVFYCRKYLYLFHLFDKPKGQVTSITKILYFVIENRIVIFWHWLKPRKMTDKTVPLVYSGPAPARRVSRGDPHWPGDLRNMFCEEMSVKNIKIYSIRIDEMYSSFVWVLSKCCRHGQALGLSLSL